jgi:hypothetical protein
MVGQPFDLLSQALGIQRFEGFDDTGVQGTTPVLQQTPRRHLMREGVLERVHVLGKQAGLVEELCSLQMC